MWSELNYEVIAWKFHLASCVSQHIGHFLPYSVDVEHIQLNVTVVNHSVTDNEIQINCVSTKQKNTKKSIRSLAVLNEGNSVTAKLFIETSLQNI